MKQNVYPLLLAALFLALLSTCRNRSIIEPEVSVQSTQDISKALKALGIHVQSIHNDHQSSHITETYELYIPQPIDHSDTSKGYFDQRVFLSHVSTGAPMVMYLSGYNANSNRYLVCSFQSIRFY